MKKSSEAHGLSYDECLAFQTDSLNRDFETLAHKLNKRLGREVVGLARIDEPYYDYTFSKRHLENLSDILYVTSDSCREDFSIDMEEDVESEACGSDGLLTITYRVIKPNVSEDVIDRAIYLYDKYEDDSIIMDITESLVPYVCDALEIN